jgi:hypothetical protein
MRSPNQFLRIRARLALETAGKPIGIVLQRAALGRNYALAILSAALSFDRSECRRHRSLLFVCRPPVRRDSLFLLSTFSPSTWPLSAENGPIIFDKQAMPNRETTNSDNTYLERLVSAERPEGYISSAVDVHDLTCHQRSGFKIHDRFRDTSYAPYPADATCLRDNENTPASITWLEAPAARTPAAKRRA